MIDWTNPKSQVTQHFNVADACELHMWKRLATPADGLNPDKLIVLCQKMEQIRTYLGCPVNVHCMFRSPAYNKQIGAPSNDVHSQNMACDFDCLPHLTCDQVKEKLLPKLEEFGIRMENNGHGASWVHIDTHSVIFKRYFKP